MWSCRSRSTTPQKSSVSSDRLAVHGRAIVTFFFVAGVLLSCAGLLAKPKVALIGLDGADWRMLDPLLKSGRLPTLDSLRAAGASGRTIAPLPLLSPLIWTTIATGRTPDEHGILDFVGFDDSGAKRPVSSYDRKCRALWNVFGESGRSVGVYGFWATWPAEKVNGEIASNLFFENLPLLHSLSESPAMLTYPPTLGSHLARPPPDLGEISSILGIDSASAERELSRRLPSPFQNRVQHLAWVLQSTHALFDLSIQSLRAKQPDLFMVYFEGPDVVSHLFELKEPVLEGAHAGTEVVARYYELIDRMLAEYRRALSSDTVLIVCSDHGFLLPGEAGGEGDPADFYTGAASYHRKYGVFLAAGPSIPKTSVDVSVLDIAPTMLAAAGLPVSREMPGKIAAIFEPSPEVRTVPTFETSPLVRVKPPGTTDEERERLQALGYVMSPSPTLSINLGRVLLEKGDLVGAEKAIMRALQIDPKRVSALYDLFDLRRRQGDQRGVVDAARRLVRASPVPRADVVASAVSAAMQSDGVAAAAALAEELAGTQPSPLKMLAEGIILAARGENQNAADAIRGAVESQPSLSSAGLPELVSIYERWGPERGIPVIEKIAASSAVPPSMLAVERGRLLAAAGRTREAIVDFQEALVELPDSGDIAVTLGQLQFKAKDVRAARRTFDRAIELDPRNDAALLGAGAAAAASDDPRAAIAYIERADYRRSPEALNALGIAYSRLGNRGRASELLRASLLLDPKQDAIREFLQGLEAR